jgi:two-component sensor histidine kinase
VAMMAGELSAAEARVIPSLSGTFGRLPAATATPLALVLTELMQNALQHGLSRPGSDTVTGTLVVTSARDNGKLTVTVADNGSGLPPGFDLENTTSLGLQIVRTMVVGELGGSLDIGARDGGGTIVSVVLPVEPLPADRP